MKNLIKCLVSASVCIGAVSHVTADTHTFAGASSTVLDSAANWSPAELPATGDTVQFNSLQDSPYTLAGDSLSVLFIKFAKDSVFDLGVGKSFLADGDSNAAKVTFSSANTTVKLLSGTFGIGDNGNRFFLGDGYANATFIASGADTILRSSLLNNIIVGQNKENNSLIVDNGAILRGGVALGLASAAAVSNKVLITGNGTRFVSGSEYYTPGDWEKSSALIGGAGYFSEFTVSNGAHMIVGDNRSVVMSVKYGQAETGGRNLFKVTHQAKASIPYLYAGHNGNSNRVEVLAGGDLSVSNKMYVGYQPRDGVTMLYGNRALVSGEDSRLFVKEALHLGLNLCSGSFLEVVDGGLLECEGAVDVGCASSHDNKLRIGEGGRMILRDTSIDVGVTKSSNSVFEVDGGIFAYTNTASVYNISLNGLSSRFSLLDGALASVSNTYIDISRYSTNALFELRDGSVFTRLKLSLTPDNRDYISGVNSRFVVDGSTLDSQGFLCTGRHEDAISNKVEFVNGATVNWFRIVIGDWGTYCSLKVDDSVVNLSGTLGFGYSRKDTFNSHSSLHVTGPNAKITISNELMPRNDTALKFTIPAEGFENQPVVSCGSFETDWLTSPSLTVERSKSHLDKERIVLIATQKKDINMETLASRLSVTLPEGCSLDLSNPREIAVCLPSLRGTMIYVR